MSRIEQMPDGTYAKRITPFEADLIERLYQEIRERKNQAALIETRLEESEISLANAHDEIEALKMEILQIKTHVGMPIT